ncbi:helix-turn-helix domain-containing protein [Mitsuaria sp. WAJ17]|uniref:XRE family transcriptional regulator n=1 Tax=Mitsuaria sp. WAJ17 TaxID=2761452 RepID=UPI0016034C5B|nr:S24 family peptidase [Mitsuaria sp. WAJ17]MBB2485384.1 helix-turn-helix domain-containing protein [Mitsuaria sp. WAJ17]
MKNKDIDQDSSNAGIGDRLRAERQRLGYMQADFGAAVGVSKTTQFNYEAGDRTPDARYLRKAAALGLDLLHVVMGTRDDSSADRYIRVPALEAQTQGGTAPLKEDGAPYEASGLCFGKDWLEARQLSAPQLSVVTVRGSSMESVLFDGDQVLVDQQDRRPRSGFVYVLRQGEELLVKYCQMLPGGILRVTSANPSFAAYDVDLAHTTELEVIGRVVASLHEW